MAWGETGSCDHSIIDKAAPAGAGLRAKPPGLLYTCPRRPGGGPPQRHGSTMRFCFPIVIIDEDFRSENNSGLGIRALAAAIEAEGS